MLRAWTCLLLVSRHLQPTTVVASGFPRAAVFTATVAMIAAALLRWRPSLVAVEGSSMSPTLRPGDWALAVRTRAIRRGDVVVARHPERPGYEIVKRIVGIPGDRVGTSVLGREEWWL